MPSREMILHLAEQLQIPMRERNVLLVAAGFAPVFVERFKIYEGAPHGLFLTHKQRLNADILQFIGA